ncbi:MAG: hypothetical protein OHK0017_04640 [Patescibacteria group bacterium]
MSINPILTKQTVLIRVCYDIPDLRSLSRIQDSLATIAEVLQQNNKVVLISHWGRPEGIFKSELSFSRALPAIQQKIQKGLTKLGVPQAQNLFVEVIDQTEPEADFAAIAKYIESSNNQIFLLENTRFIPEEQSKKPNQRQELAKKYAKLGKFLVCEDFAVSHRQEATVQELKEYLPHTNGSSYQAELKNLDRIKNTNAKPVVVVLGGAKLETKLPLIQSLLPKVDYLLIGGAICFTFLQAANSSLNLGDAPIESSFIHEAKEILKKFKQKIILPQDFIYTKNITPADIGPKTIHEFSEKITMAGTIFWNGPMGKYENPKYRQGTKVLADLIANQMRAFRVVGGGDTNAAIPAKLLKKFSFVSMGGGATLEYLGQD